MLLKVPQLYEFGRCTEITRDNANEVMCPVT